MEFPHEGELPGALSLRVFGSPNALAQAVAGRVHEAVMTGVRARSRALLVLDTGPVLRRGYSLLAPAALPWSSVQIALSPARTNELATARAGFLRDTLLHGPAAEAQLMLPDVNGAAADEEADLLMLAMSANGSIAKLGEAAKPGSRAFETRRIVIVGQGLAARDVFERQALAPPGSGSVLQDLAQHATQPVEFCWCR
jgi:6-phosphogluconolactonase/glucosamine-6-phosphate isomerase/deaminase